MSEIAHTTPDQDERLMAAIAHAGFVTGVGPIFSLLVLLLRGKDSQYIRVQAAQALAADLIIYLFAVVLGIGWTAIAILVAFIPTLSGSEEAFAISAIALTCVMMAVLLAYLVLRLVAAVRTYRGEDYRYPLIGEPVARIVRQQQPPAA
ncbi:MAG: hypothetical protein Kow00124_28900 [Anaerolineae bacterium]